MSEMIKLKNEHLCVEIRIPESEPFSQRFDSCAMVHQVTLHEKHTFCQQEQNDPHRVNTFGEGLSSEIFWNDLPKEMAKGELFPKFGVGAMAQVKDHEKYTMWDSYPLTKVTKCWTSDQTTATFEEFPLPASGYSAHIFRHVTLHANTLTITTTIENTGEKAIHCSEFQHNFMAIDNLPVGPGYTLYIPFDKELATGPWKSQRLDEKGIPTETIHFPASISDHCIRWEQKMENQRIHKITLQEGIDILPRYFWTLSHDASDASVTEVMHFRPSRMSIWAIEHVISPEVHYPLDLEPGDVVSFARTWIFNDGRTTSL